MNKKKVIKIARIVRMWCEQEYPNTFGRDTPISKRKDLEGMCGVASYILFKELAHAGIESSFMINDHHAFLVVTDSIVDLTARQFNPTADKIFIHPWPIEKKSPSLSWYDNAVECISISDIKKVMQETWWDSIDNPIVFFEMFKYPSEKQLAVIERKVNEAYSQTPAEQVVRKQRQNLLCKTTGRTRLR